MTTVPTDGWWPQLCELLDRQRGICAELQLIESEQASITAGGYADMAARRRLQIRRRNAVDQFARVVQKVEPFRRSWVSFGPSLISEHRDALRRAVEEASKTVGATLNRERRIACG